jgi:hypothetical protein
MIRPGPPSIATGQAPGGVVVRVYSVPDQALLLEQHLTRDADVEHLAISGADIVDALTDPGGEVCIIAYDGDSGERVSIRDAMRDAR